MKFSPCNAWVMLRMKDTRETRSRGGVILLEGTSDSQFMKGTVVATGPGLWSTEQVKRIPMVVKAGDEVVFVNGGLEYVLDGLKYVLIQENNIVGILTGEDGNGVSEGDRVGRSETVHEVRRD